MPNALRERLRAHGFQLPDYDGGGLVNIASTVLELCGARCMVAACVGARPNLLSAAAWTSEKRSAGWS